MTMTIHKFNKLYTYILYFIGILGLLIYTKHTTMGENWDDYIVWFLLKNGIDMTLIISYPLSKLLAYLYIHYPTYQWFSYMYLSYILLCISLASYIIYHTKLNQTKILLLVFYTLCFIYLLLNFSITLLTGLSIILSLSVIFYNYKLFIFGMLLSFLLRTELIIIYVPFILLFFLMFHQHINKLSIQDKIITLFSITIIMVTLYSPKTNDIYKNWLSFNSARGYFLDSKTKLPIFMAEAKQKVTKYEGFLLDIWWIQDKDILPSNKVISASGSIWDRISLSSFYLYQLILNSLSNFYLIIILLYTYTTFLLLSNKQYKLTSILFLSTLLIFIIFIFRDVERVMLPLIILWFTIVYYIFELKLRYMPPAFLIVIFIMFSITFHKYINFSTNYNKIKNLKNELIILTNSLHKNYEISLQYPYLKAHNYIDKIIKQQHIMYEQDWLDLHKYHIYLPFGWLARHPYFYNERDITFKNLHKKYKNYYQFLTDETTAFIGEIKKADKNSQTKFLQTYDDFYNKTNTCQHQIVLLKQSKHFSISQIINNCRSTNGEHNDTIQ